MSSIDWFFIGMVLVALWTTLAWANWRLTKRQHQHDVLHQRVRAFRQYTMALRWEATDVQLQQLIAEMDFLYQEASRLQQPALRLEVQRHGLETLRRHNTIDERV